MEALTIPKFENETDEANWLYEEPREFVWQRFMRRCRRGVSGKAR